MRFQDLVQAFEELRRPMQPGQREEIVWVCEEEGTGGGRGGRNHHCNYERRKAGYTSIWEFYNSGRPRAY